MARRIKKVIKIFLIIVVILLVAGAIYLFTGKNMDSASDSVEKGTKNTKTLVVYFSRQGEIKGDNDAVSAATKSSNGTSQSDTRTAAKMIQKATGADLYQIKTKKYYRKSFMGTATKAWIEERLNQRPELAAKLKNLDQYDTIYVGYPIWWFQAPMAVGTFLESYNLSGKTVIPFCTSQDNDIDVSMDYIKKAATGADVLEGKRIYESTQEEITQWIDQISKKNSENEKIQRNKRQSDI